MIPHSKSPTISKLNIYDNAIEFLSDFKKPCSVSKSCDKTTIGKDNAIFMKNR